MTDTGSPEITTLTQDTNKASFIEILELFAFQLYLAKVIEDTDQEVRDGVLPAAHLNEAVLSEQSMEKWREDEYLRATWRSIAERALRSTEQHGVNFSAKKTKDIRNRLTEIITIPARPAYNFF